MGRGPRGRFDTLVGGPGRPTSLRVRLRDAFSAGPRPHELTAGDTERPSAATGSAEAWWGRHPLARLATLGLILAVCGLGPFVASELLRSDAVTAPDGRHPPAGLGASPTRVLPAVPPPTGVSNAMFAWMQTQPGGREPVTFDPCRPIHYVTRVNPANPTAETLIREAVHVVSTYSGLQFIDDGRTTEAPIDDRLAHQPERYGDRWAPVLIAWSDTVEEPRLEGNAGLGGPVPWHDSSGRLTNVTGTVWLNGPMLQSRLSSPQGHHRIRAIVMHELGHVLGANHPASMNQLMSDNGDHPLLPQTGDLYAWAVLGSGRCAPEL